MQVSVGRATAPRSWATTAPPPRSLSLSRSLTLTLTRPRRQVYHVHDVERGRHLDTRRGSRSAAVAQACCSAQQLRDRAAPILADRSGRLCRNQGRRGRPARPKRLVGRGWPKLGAASGVAWCREPAGRGSDLVADVLQVILLALERGCTRRDDIVDFVNQRSRSINPCGKPLPRGFGQLALQL